MRHNEPRVVQSRLLLVIDYLRMSLKAADLERTQVHEGLLLWGSASNT